MGRWPFVPPLRRGFFRGWRATLEKTSKLMAQFGQLPLRYGEYVRLPIPATRIAGLGFTYLSGVQKFSAMLWRFRVCQSDRDVGAGDQFHRLQPIYVQPMGDTVHPCAHQF